MNWLRAAIGLLLLPLGAGLTRTVIALAAASGARAGGEQAHMLLALLAGLAAWSLVFVLLPRPARAYVLAHELTHALWGAMGGARVSGLKVSRQGGWVQMSQVSWLTALAPYFFPLYTAAVLLAYALAALVCDLRRWEWLWFGLLGLTLGFHWTFTVAALARPQSDLQVCGRLFALPLIYCLNLLVLGALLTLATPLTRAQFGERLVGDVAGAYRACGAAAVAVVATIKTAGSR